MSVDYTRERHEARDEAERLGLDRDDRPTRADLAGDTRPQRDPAKPHLPDPWQTEMLTAGDRVWHILNTDPAARRDGTGTIAQRRRLLAGDVDYLVDYDKGGQGWHLSFDVRKAGGDDVPPF